MDNYIMGNKSKKLYKVQSIVGTARVRMDRHPKKIIRHFRIHWKGYPINDATWQPQSNLPQLKELCQDYMNNITQQQRNYTVDERDLQDFDSHEPSLNRGSRSGAKGEQAGHKHRKKIQRHNNERKSSQMSKKDSQFSSQQNVSEDYAYRTFRKQVQDVKADPFEAIREKYVESSKDPKDAENEKIERVLRGIRCEDGQIEVLVEWERSQDGSRRQEQFIPKKWVLHFFPHKMLEFYERTVRWL